MSHSGNFGFHEGLNYGGPLGDPWEYLGFQVGADDAQSNFTGDQVAGTPTWNRNQIFLTGGLFHRAVGDGWQSAVTFDYLHDDYYPQADLKLIRSESAYASTNGTRSATGAPTPSAAARSTLPPGSPLSWSPTTSSTSSTAATSPAAGRAAFGSASPAAATCSSAPTAPSRWAPTGRLENNFAYLLPREGLGAAGQDREVWAVSIQLVWYPGRASRLIFDDPWQPVLNVADDSVFMVNRR